MHRTLIRRMADAQHFQYVVIGAGSAGIASARRAASYGAKVAVIESGGCAPAWAGPG
jgi:pyruvate/2-oxoglutarate dehydrogenase complex dihydrolipoamide dehydrogenase (E3) component